MNLFGSFLIAMLWSVLSNPRHSTSMKVKFTNLICEEHDTDFCTFKRCDLKALRRDTVSLNTHLQIHKLPIDSATINVALFVKGNGYRPYMYNTTLNWCNFIKNPSRYAFWKLVYDMGKGSTNLNHSCPYNHDLIVHDMILNANMFKLIPFPPNYYMIRLIASVANRVRAECRYYIQIYD